MAKGIAAVVEQRHQTIVDSLASLKKSISAGKTPNGDDISLKYIEAWLHTDLTYLVNLFAPDDKIVPPKAYKDDTPR